MAERGSEPEIVRIGQPELCGGVASAGRSAPERGADDHGGDPVGAEHKGSEGEVEGEGDEREEAAAGDDRGQDEDYGVHKGAGERIGKLV